MIKAIEDISNRIHNITHELDEIAINGVIKMIAMNKNLLVEIGKEVSIDGV